MSADWEIAYQDIDTLKIVANDKNDPVSILHFNENCQLKLIGVGTDAAVFQHKDLPSYVFKIFDQHRLEKMEAEQEVYHSIGQSDYFPIYFGGGPNFIVLSYIEGITLYDCLLKGVHIPKHVIEQVENARAEMIEKGLNPRDIHLKNIILNDGRVKLVDVSEYMKPGDDKRWEYLRKGYEQFYHLIDGREVPLWMIETVRKWYNQSNSATFKYNEFVKKIEKLFKWT